MSARRWDVEMLSHTNHDLCQVVVALVAVGAFDDVTIAVVG
jgi:hypothetical protein